ncbi:centrosome-associated protein CEP250-like [Labeo rohita]|uniref:Centrosome-associated protein CEP250-like n=2 Tax=Labeo rohita TaxID=84645 RepID=A0A498N8R7_LABRO|nr:centrosome-associated protein CEP250-like [Labeo rohita]
MATLKELLEDSHREGERLRSMMQEKKDEWVRNKEEGIRAAQIEAEDLLHKVQMLEKQKQELKTALQLQEEQLKKKNEQGLREKEQMQIRQEKLEEELATIKNVAEQREAELTRARARMDILEDQRTELSSLAAERTREAEELSNTFRELRLEVDRLREDRRRESKDWEELKRENKEKQGVLEGLELLRKTLSEKEMEMELMKEKYEKEKKRKSEKFHQAEEQNIRQLELLSERLKDKETELESIREMAYKEQSAKLRLQDQLEDEKRNTKILREKMETLENELETKMELDLRNLRESEKKNNGLKKDSGLGTLSDFTEINAEYQSHERLLETDTLRKDLTKREQEIERLRTQVQTLQAEIDRLHSTIRNESIKTGPPENEAWERLKDQTSAVLLEKEERDRLLREKDTEVYALKERVEELSKDRDRVRTALEKTEATLIYYKERLEQQEHKKKRAEADTLEEKEFKPKAQSVNEVETDSAVQGRLSAMQRAVAQLEVEQNLLQKKNNHLEKKIERLRTERQHLRETLTQVELERGKLRNQLSQTKAGVLAPSDGTEKEELKRLRIRANELEEQVHQLRLMLAVDHQQRAEFIDRSLKNSKSLMSLRQDLNESLAAVFQRPVPSVLESETQRLDRSIREEELRLSLSQS